MSIFLYLFYKIYDYRTILQKTVKYSNIIEINFNSLYHFNKKEKGGYYRYKRMDKPELYNI